MSPILVRPVREQIEHDRIVRLLHARSRRRYEVGMNPGTEQNAAVTSGATSLYPDLVLLSQDRGRRLQAVIEVETGESVNHLEALAQWANLSKLKADFHLYVPSSMVEVARRLCEDNQIYVNEIWSYHTVGDEMRFTPVHRPRGVAPSKTKRATVPGPKTASTTSTTSTTARRPTTPAKPAKTAKSARPAKPAKTAKPASRAKSSKKPARPKKRR